MSPFAILFRLITMTIMLVIVVLVLAVMHKCPRSDWNNLSAIRNCLSARQNELISSAVELPLGKIEVPLNPMEEYDYKTKEEILQVRRYVIEQHPVLGGSSYRPSAAVFGQIAEKSPWWGIEGIYFYGKGKKSISGWSEESRLIDNPFLLVGLIETSAYQNSLAPEQYVSYYPRPSQLWFEPRANRGGVFYDVRSHFEHLEKHDYPKNEKKLRLVAYNARDFGYNFIYIDSQKSSGIVPNNPDKRPIRIRQFIHLGSSCGHPVGCNNMSPVQRYRVQK